jgi:bifunctional non-homologous end joining protein LigD
LSSAEGSRERPRHLPNTSRGILFLEIRLFSAATYISRMLRAAAFIEPCLPSPADKPPSGADWIHEIKHDGYRLMARRDPVGIRLLTRNGNDWSARFPLVVEAVNHLTVRSCLIDGEVVCCDEKGVAAFQLLRHRRNEPLVSVLAFRV